MDLTMKEPTKETTEMTQTASTTMMDFSPPPPPPFRYTNAQKNHTLIHPRLPQPLLETTTTTMIQKDETDLAKEAEKNQQQSSPSPLSSLSSPIRKQEEEEDDDDDEIENPFFFIVCADTQLGMTLDNRDWQEEIAYSKQAVEYMNQMDPSPLFCCVCGDLVHMEALIYAGTTETWKKDRKETWTVEQCYEIQDRQNRDFQTIWNELNDNIALVCVCGNHDVGNRPTRTSIQRFNRTFGDDRLAFWAKGRCYNVVLNTSLFNDPTGALDLYQEQLEWMQERFQYAVDNQATHIFVFGHHPWFLYRQDEDEKAGDLPGVLIVADDKHEKSGQIVADDAYFVIPLERRRQVLDMFKKYNVTAAFAGHFHQNLVTKTSFGMEMITTSALSVVLQSNGIPKDFNEPQTRGLRRVNVKAQQGQFDHEFISL